MPIMTNFTQLVAVARTYLNRDSSVVPDANAISFAVQSAEATFTAALKPPGTLVTTTLTTTGRYTPLPNNFVEIQRAVLLHNEVVWGMAFISTANLSTPRTYVIVVGARSTSVRTSVRGACT